MQKLFLLFVYTPLWENMVLRIRLACYVQPATVIGRINHVTSLNPQNINCLMLTKVGCCIRLESASFISTILPQILPPNPRQPGVTNVLSTNNAMEYRYLKVRLLQSQLV